MRMIYWIATLIFLLVVSVFAINNHEAVSINLWPFDLQVQMPLALLTLGMLFAGIIIGGIFTLISTIPYRIEACRLRREVASLNAKLVEEREKSLSIKSKTEGNSLIKRFFSFRFFQKGKK